MKGFGSGIREQSNPSVAWLMAARTQNRTGMCDVVATFSKTSPINAERRVFDICGGNYRLIVGIVRHSRMPNDQVATQVFESGDIRLDPPGITVTVEEFYLD